MKQLHLIQLQILRKLLFATSLRYTEMKPDNEMLNNQFDFHLDQIIKEGWVTKTKEGYFLTSSGKEYANRMNTGTATIEKQAKIGAIVCAFCERNGKRQYLVYTRLKQPFYGCQGFMSGKIAYGETVIDGAKRELKEETNLDGEPQVFSIRHFRVFDKQTGELLEDKFLYYCLVRNPEGEIVDSAEGKYEWIDEDKIDSHVTNHFESLEVFKRDVEEINSFRGEIRFSEVDHISDKF